MRQYNIFPHCPRAKSLSYLLYSLPCGLWCRITFFLFLFFSHIYIFTWYKTYFHSLSRKPFPWPHDNLYLKHHLIVKWVNLKSACQIQEQSNLYLKHHLIARWFGLKSACEIQDKSTLYLKHRLTEQLVSIQIHASAI